MNELKLNNKTMSSLEIAELTGKRHDHVKSSIEKIILELGLDLPSFRDVYINKQNQKVEIFNLNEDLTLTLVAGYNVKVRHSIIKRWQELESNNLPAIPQNYAEALQLAANQAKEIEFKDDLIIASNEASIKAGDIKVSEFVKSTDIVDLGRNQFYDWLREQGYLFQNSREPIQAYVSRGFFKWLPTEEEHGGKIQHTLFITARGKVWLAAKYMQFIDAE